MITWIKEEGKIRQDGGWAKVYREGVCLAADTKPTTNTTMLNGSKLIEMDTGLEYLYDEAGKQWLQFPPAAETAEDAEEET